MIFSLEALQAQHGDALLLHYGPEDSPGLIVIDGGPDGVYTGSLLPRLEELRASRHPEGSPLKIRLLLVSHIDADHIQGILELTEHLLGLQDDGNKLPFRIVRLWHNSFSDLVKKVKLSGLTKTEAHLKPVAFGGEVPADIDLDRSSALVLASVTQGRQLRKNAEALSLLTHDDLISAPETGGAKVHELSDDLRFTVLGPMQRQLDKLQNDWAKKIEDKKKKGILSESDAEIALAEFVDKSVYNLSSIVVLAESHGRTMLLTGDARGDHVLMGLELAGCVKQGETLHVDVMKVPHHGSQRNVEPVFFQRITADHYVISANGRYGNPDEGMLRMLFEARSGEPYTILMTYPVERLQKFLEDNKPKEVEILYPEPDKLSVRVDLEAALKD